MRWSVIHCLWHNVLKPRGIFESPSSKASFILSLRQGGSGVARLLLGWSHALRCAFFFLQEPSSWLTGGPINPSFGLVHGFAHFFLLQWSVGFVALRLRSHSTFSAGCVFFFSPFHRACDLGPETPIGMATPLRSS